MMIYSLPREVDALSDHARTFGMGIDVFSRTLDWLIYVPTHVKLFVHTVLHRRDFRGGCQLKGTR